MNSVDDKHGDLNGQLAELTKHNHDMLKNAEAGRWDKVIEAEILRRKLLEALYSSSDIKNAPGVASATREMLSVNQKMEKLAISAHKQATTEVVSFNKGRQAVSTYEKFVR